jgi:hypothetical protein
LGQSGFSQCAPDARPWWSHFQPIRIATELNDPASRVQKTRCRELATWSAIGHGLLLIISLFPVPIVDGGTLLKWTLVARGRAETEADKIVQRVDWGLGLVIGIIGVGLLALQIWIAGVILVGISVVTFL